jgi:hypothetical protein
VPVQHLLRRRGQTAAAAGIGQANGLAGFRIQEEEGLRLLGRPLPGGGTALDHVPLGVADQAMRVQGQKPAREVTAGSAQLAQRGLELLGLRDGVSFEQIVRRAVGGQEGQAVGQFKTLVPQGTVLAQAGSTQRGFMHQVQGQARGQGALGWIARPGAQQIPSAQAQMFGDQQPQSQEVAGNFIGQKLANLAFQTGGVGLFDALAFSGALHRQQGGRVFGVQRAEFFLQAIIGDDPFDAAQADGEMSLPEFLGDDLGRGFGIQKAIAQDLAHHLVGAAIIGFGAGFPGLQGQEAALLEGVEDLVIALAAITIFLRDGGDVSIQALAFLEHEEAAGEFVGVGNGEGTGGAGELLGRGIEQQGSLHRGRLTQGT